LRNLATLYGGLLHRIVQRAFGWLLHRIVQRAGNDLRRPEGNDQQPPSL